MQASQLARPRPASSYPQWEGSPSEDLIARVQALGLADQGSPGQPEANGNHHQQDAMDEDGFEDQAGVPCQPSDSGVGLCA